MSNQLIIQPDVLPTNQVLQEHLNSSVFLTNNVWKIAFSPCSEYLAIPKQDIYGQYCVLIMRCSDWNATNITDTDLCLHNRFTCTSAIWSLAFGEGKLSSNSIIKSNFYETNSPSTPKPRRELLERRRSSLSVVNRRYDFTNNIFLAAGLADGRINVWNINTGELTLILKDHRSTVCGLDFTSSTMQLASCSHDTKIKLWDLLDDGNMYKTLNEWTHVINAVKWSPDETLLCAVGPYELVVLYDTTTWQELFKLEGHLNSVADCVFSSDSALLATASYDTRVILWSTITGEIIKSFAHKIPIPLKIYAGGDNGAFVRSVVMTKYNHVLVTACDDNKVRWFPLVSSQSSKVIHERTETNVLCVAITSDSKTMAVSNRNGEVHLLSALSTLSTSQPSSLKYFCRLLINSSCGMNRKEILNLSIPQHLISYLLYRDIKMK
ncbi:unnamed protein product [Adineta steineri]|uniref:SOCS box domain-containing protein n=1 Tax=Adineta steineri TaxID=433720 RepID=A0A815ZLD3_9BILA|nr:unnamed protein product [Adineta steineri]CAF1584977.1 unnamed protein product [Adineta steineri]CAF3875943.1 unnamed protein product [Adineta steineri]